MIVNCDLKDLFDQFNEKYAVQVEYDCRNNKKYDWVNLEFNLVNIKTGAKSEIPITSMFGN